MSETMPSDDRATLEAQLEALLFLYGEPVTHTRAAKLLSQGADEPIEPERIAEAALSLQRTLAEQGRGVRLAASGDTLQLVTAPQFALLTETLVKAEVSETLTPAALETLAIICYGGAVPRSTVDYVRGVNSSFMVRALMTRGLIERVSDAARPSGYRYRPTVALLNHLGVSRIEELPERERFMEIIAKLQGANAH